MNLKMAAYLTSAMMATTASAFSRSTLTATTRRRAAVMTTASVTRSRSTVPRTDNHNHKHFRLFSTVEEATAETSSSTTTIDEQARDEAALANLKSPFLQTMRDRGFLFQCTNLSELDALLTDATSNNEAISAYLGFDATADSLHVGSLLQIMILRHLQQSGHRPIVLIGGGTSKVGDPTGKDESRIMLTDEIIQQNTDGISQVFQKFLSFEVGHGGQQPQTNNDEPTKKNTDAIMVNNDDWLSSLKYLQFLRDYGTHFTINRMMSFESVKQRLDREAPFSFLEFNYMILQAYDFLELHRRYNAQLQLGGSDQWGNMISGVELGRRVDSAQLYALTAPLITTSDGKKMGKTAGGAIWLNSDKLSEYDYWQFWRNTSDDDVIRFMKLFTELPLDEIGTMEQNLQGAEINKAKIVLADEATALLHGRECLKAIHDTVDSMFKGGKSAAASTEGLARIFISKDEATSGLKFLDLFVQLKLANSKKEARRLIQGGGAKLGDEKITDENGVLDMDGFDGKSEVTLRAGKKRAGVVELK